MKKIAFSRTIAAVALLAVAFCLNSCGEPVAPAEPIATKPATEPDDPRLEKARNLIVTLPSPFETLTMMRHAGVIYDREIVNPVENLKRYKGSIDQAINLGIYGTDLSYSSVFEQNDASVKYLACVAKLTENLNIDHAFSPMIMDRLMANKSNSDSVQQIVASAYYTANGSLKARDEEHLAAIILAGGWIEGLYIATELQKKYPDNEDLLFTISDQQYALANLLELLESFDGHARIQELMEQLRALQPFYAGTDNGEATVAETTKGGKQVTVIGGSDSGKMSATQLEGISEHIAAIRNELTGNATAGEVGSGW